MALPFVSSNKNNKVASIGAKAPAHGSDVDLLKAEKSAFVSPPRDGSYLVRAPRKASNEFKVSAEAYALSRV